MDIDDASTLTQKPTKRDRLVPKPGDNVPGSIENVPACSLFKQLLDRLPAKRARFVEEYLIDLDATKSALRVGYSKKTAGPQGRRLLRFVPVKQAIEAGKLEISERNKDKFEEGMEELRVVAFSDIKDYVTVDPLTGAIQCKGFEDMPEGSSRAIEVIQEDRVIRESADGNSILLNDKRKFKLHGKVQALIAYIDRLKPPVQKLDVTVAGTMTNFPPKPRTMAEWEILVKGGSSDAILDAPSWTPGASGNLPG